SAGNSVALGAGSSAARGAQENYEAYGMAQPQSSTGEVNVGGRQMTGVAAGSEDTDAVNVGQLRAASSASEARVGAVEHSLQNLRSDLESQERMLSAGVAAAMATASLPQAYLPGRNMLSSAGGTWNGAQLRSRKVFTPWNRPQSSRIRRPSISSRWREPVTVPAAPRKHSIGWFDMVPPCGCAASIARRAPMGNGARRAA
ncbi:hypothetical protein DAI43_33230, partial [Achromobacter xylosoxidans]